MIAGCSTSVVPLDIEKLPYTPKENELVVYVISPVGYFAPYESYLININGMNRRLYFGSYTFLSLNKDTNKLLSGTYQFSSDAKIGYSEDVKKTHFLEEQSIAPNVGIYFLIRDGGDFIWIEQSKGLREMSKLKFMEPKQFVQ